ncbi:outer membrane lipid asymmetry maintenance protein MlaD [Caulobacter sp. KR2-114]|uniref:outer membrane lipid asymmetry maintenance protein MlaD n=1 Tax=Caulobacter sp. KR2-114 TaxID=3400912 RepID=UPI003C06D43E
MAKGQWAETGVGAAVIVAAAGFLAYSLTVGGSVRAHGYEVRARFGQIGSLAPGGVVSVAGVKVGTVASIRLDPKTYLATATLDLDPAIPLPADSTAKITSDGLMGGSHVVIEPGAASETLKAGGEIENTQGAVDLLTLIGQFLRPPASAAKPGAAAPAQPSGD